jgi:hypothetical protein
MTGSSSSLAIPSPNDFYIPTTETNDKLMSYLVELLPLLMFSGFLISVGEIFSGYEYPRFC